MIEQIALPRLAGTAAGTVTTTAPVNGELLAVYVASNCAGTATLATLGNAPATLMTLTGGAGTATYFPRPQGCDSGGTAISGVYDTYPLADYVTLATNAGGTVTAVLVVNRGRW